MARDLKPDLQEWENPRYWQQLCTNDLPGTPKDRGGGQPVCPVSRAACAHGRAVGTAGGKQKRCAARLPVPYRAAPSRAVPTRCLLALRNSHGSGAWWGQSWSWSRAGGCWLQTVTSCRTDRTRRCGLLL